MLSPNEILKTLIAVFASFGVICVTLILSDKVLAANVTDDPTNFSPNAVFRITATRGTADRPEGTIGSKFTFDARLSNDPEGQPLLYMWDLDGDSKYDTNWLSEPTIEKIYFELGEKTIKLVIKDEHGNYDHETHNIKIVKNTAPTAFFEVTPSSGSPEQEFKFKAVLSEDDQFRSNQLQFRWDFDGNGVYDTNWLRTNSISHKYGYGKKGIYKATLQVRDPEDYRSTFKVEIEVLENSVPVATIDVSPNSGVFNTRFKISGERSFDDETEFKDLKFRWDTNYSGPNDIVYDNSFTRYGYTKTITFNKENQEKGEQMIKLEVMDKDGEVATAITTIKLHWASKYIKELMDERIISSSSVVVINPDKEVTRGEVVELVVGALRAPTQSLKSQTSFKDVVASNRYSRFIAYGKEKGFLKGYPDNTFRPNGSITRAEALSLMINAFDIPILENGYQIYRDVPTKEWYFKYVDTGTANSLVSGYDTGDFGPHKNITYGEIAKIIYQLIHLNKL